MSSIEVNELLHQMRSMASMAENKIPAETGESVSGADFAQLLKDSVDKVNQTQKSAAGLATAFESGDPSVNLSEVMVAIQKGQCFISGNDAS